MKQKKKIISIRTDNTICLNMSEKKNVKIKQGDPYILYPLHPQKEQ